MARSTTVTLLPLDRYAQIMQIPATHFNQLNGVKAPLLKGCGETLWDQNGWDDLAWTMVEAEEMIATELGFWPSPKFIVDEQVSLGLTGISSDWFNAESHTEWRHVQAYGTETLTLKQANAGVEYSNSNNNPLERENLATIGTAIYDDLPACNSACEVAVFFRVADGAEDAADPRWEIKPLKVDIDGSTMRITAESSQFIRPNLIALTEADCKGSNDVNKWRWDFDTSNLVSQVDVYCRTVNTILPLTLRWDNVCGCNTTICEHVTQTGCAYRTDNKNGYFIARPASGTNVLATPQHTVPPESILVNYRSGYPVNSLTCRMNAQLERAIVKLTNVLLPEPPCGFCDAAQTRWKNDRKNIDPLTPEAASLPWDLYSQGALEAWRIVKKFARGRGGKM